MQFCAFTGNANRVFTNVEGYGRREFGDFKSYDAVTFNSEANRCACFKIYFIDIRAFFAAFKEDRIADSVINLIPTCFRSGKACAYAVFRYSESVFANLQVRRIYAFKCFEGDDNVCGSHFAVFGKFNVKRLGFACCHIEGIGIGPIAFNPSPVIILCIIAINTRHNGFVVNGDGISTCGFSREFDGNVGTRI